MRKRDRAADTISVSHDGCLVFAYGLSMSAYVTGMYLFMYKFEYMCVCVSACVYVCL